MVVVDPAHQTVWLCRDALGNRSLFYTFIGDRLLFASEEAALIAAGANTRFNEERIRSFLALDTPAPNSTFFCDIHEVPAGACVKAWPGARPEIHRYYRPALEPGLWQLSVTEAADRLHQHVENAVLRALPQSGPTAVAMSGGMDSSVIATIAARHRPVLACSYTFPDQPDCDEARWIDDICQYAGLDATSIEANRFPPLAADTLSDMGPNSPERTIYHPLRHGLGAAARSGGAEWLLSGDFGDHLYLHWPNWVRDAIRCGQWGLAGQELKDCWLHGRRRLTALTGYRERQVEAPWLRRPYQGAVSPVPHPAMGDRAARDASNHRIAFLRHGIDHRLPYRDRALFEFFLSLPAHLLFRQNCYKWLTRKAFSNALPASVTGRKHATNVTAFLYHEMYEKAPSMFSSALNRYDAWRHYVRPDWVKTAVASKPVSRPFIVLWRALCFGRWVDLHY